MVGEATNGVFPFRARDESPRRHHEEVAPENSWRDRNGADMGDGVGSRGCPHRLGHCDIVRVPVGPGRGQLCGHVQRARFRRRDDLHHCPRPRRGPPTLRPVVASAIRCLGSPGRSASRRACRHCGTARVRPHSSRGCNRRSVDATRRRLRRGHAGDGQGSRRPRVAGGRRRCRGRGTGRRRCAPTDRKRRERVVLRSGCQPTHCFVQLTMHWQGRSRVAECAQTAAISREARRSPPPDRSASRATAWYTASRSAFSRGSSCR